MDAVSLQGIEYDECHACDAHWFDTGELKEILAQEGILFSEKALSLGLSVPNTCRWCETSHPDRLTRCPHCSRSLGHKCPRDGRSMLTSRFGDLEIDVCFQCHGLWFDGEEFALLKWSLGVEETPPKVNFEGKACQLCGEVRFSELKWGGGFLKCKPCLTRSVENEEDLERLERLRERNLEHWRDLTCTDRFLGMNVAEKLKLELRRIRSLAKRPAWLSRLADYF